MCTEHTRGRTGRCRGTSGTSLVVLLGAAAGACLCGGRQAGLAAESVPEPKLPSPGRPYRTSTLLHSEDFDRDLSRWVVQQMPGGKTSIRAGSLDVRDRKGCTIWFKEKLQGPLMIEYDATMRSDHRVSDLNCFWMAIDPKDPGNILAKRRSGSFSQYHPLRLYYVGYGGNKNKTTRFRRYPGGGERPLLAKHDLKDKRFRLKPDKTMKIQLVACGSIVQYVRDGEIVFDFRDEKPYREGWFGFRTVNSHMVIDNFRVYRLEPVVRAAGSCTAAECAWQRVAGSCNVRLPPARRPHLGRGGEEHGTPQRSRGPLRARGGQPRHPDPGTSG